MPIAKLNGVDLSYSVTGSGDPLVLLAGFGSNMDFWSDVLSEASGRFTVVTVDNRGSGATEYDGPFTIDDMADDVAKLLKRLSFEKAHVLGWSMGSQVAQSLAIRYPDKVSTLALVSSYLRRPERSSFMLHGMIEAVRDGMPLKYLSVPLKAMCFPERYFSTKKRKTAEDFGYSVDGLEDQIRAVDLYSTEDNAHMIMAPTLSIHGSEDYMVPLDFGDALADRIRDCTMIRLRGEGHNIMPSKYIENYLSFAMSHGR
ncbi:MAG: alpha/beta hydrolase [Candidatus Methanomethylophilaceae archaeon]|jgi:pimeloyl-ACP methyl ester carboxylesterase|nr:alpha/beta hydrolase [Candidatus Methanomethylophilaceae archaeon]MDD2936016.1 alpha/beta hydrolase [Candidatus Methanomethylophilaceae archaeon]MDD3351600.1 alpha/beta hydrolase [Candidatus Methanomethylophilaceae archaeon]MDD3986812.1 alpha/beta hydrolase [Candidatus Methanomethylophilaceae archaeon]MDD4709414.1 alpha/beta hydrolase [Candidatus Methanomethylophilaceae archaeon]